MPKKAPPTAVRSSASGSYMILKDGRKIAVPPKGGKISRKTIQRAVKKVRAQEDTTASAG